MSEQGKRAEGEYYRVEVSDHEGQIVSIEPRMLAGRDIGPREERAIRESIRSLCGFLGLSPLIGEAPEDGDGSVSVSEESQRSTSGEHEE